MSADNYGIIHKTKDGKYGLSQGFASCDGELSLDNPYFVAETLEEVEVFADKEYFEYGWSYDFAVKEKSKETLWTVQVMTEDTEHKNDIPWHYSYQVPTFYVEAATAADATAKALEILPAEGMANNAHVHHNLTITRKE